MGVFQDTIAGGLSAIRQAAGVTVIIRRAGQQSEPVTAAIGPQAFTQNPVDGGIIQQAESRTYLIAVADYVLDGQPTEPQKGDLIDETIGGNVIRHEVSSDGAQEWDFTDLGQTQYTVHTKNIGDA